MFMAKSYGLRVWVKVYKIIKGEVRKVRKEGGGVGEGENFFFFFFGYSQY